MYRMLVVDDEEIITNSLVSLIQNTLDNVDVYPAYSGTEAIEYMSRAGFDLVLTDIQMPGMSGIELISRVREFYPQCRVIFLSGYDDFEYAYQAVQFHAERYILKNEGDEVILKTIRNTLEEIEAEAEKNEILNRAREHILRCAPVLKREIIWKMLHTAFAYPEKSDNSFVQLDIMIRAEEPVVLLAARIDDPAASDTPTAVDMVVRSFLEENLCCECCMAENSAIIWIIQAKAGASVQQAVSIVRGSAERLQRVCAQSLSGSVSFVLDTAPAEWNILLKRIEKIRSAMESFQESPGRMAFVYLDYLEQRTEGESGTRDDQLIRYVNRYIADHLHQDLSLVTLSEKVGLNPSYLSRRYKELTSQNLSDVITHQRLDRAKKLLEEDNQKINQIAEQVGYYSATNFIRVFKKTYCMTPQEWRSRKGNKP